MEKEWRAKKTKPALKEESSSSALTSFEEPKNPKELRSERTPSPRISSNLPLPASPSSPLVLLPLLLPSIRVDLAKIFALVGIPHQSAIAGAFSVYISPDFATADLRAPLTITTVCPPSTS
ncbi:hypothetical protein C0995_008916 [Termitomyces sp. Mi166|nr:hypothetical protein C0995_008912 [Termitomyces sp. Mi166\